jgi:hypothetical protein
VIGFFEDHAVAIDLVFMRVNHVPIILRLTNGKILFGEIAL